MVIFQYCRLSGIALGGLLGLSLLGAGLASAEVGGAASPAQSEGAAKGHLGEHGGRVTVAGFQAERMRGEAPGSSVQAPEAIRLAQAAPTSPQAASADPAAPAGAQAPAAPATSAPACSPTKVADLIERFKTAEASLRRAPSTALDSLRLAETSLACLTEVPTQAQLQNLFRLKGLAMHLAKTKVSAQESFYQAAALDSSLNCDSALSGYSTPALTRELIDLCEKATLEAADTEIRVRLIQLKGAQAIYVDGAEQTLGDDFLSLRLIAAQHLIQVKSLDQVRSAWVEVKIPEGEDARFQEIDLRKLKLIQVLEQKVQVGSLRLEGLEPGTEVMVDGRTRRDLPVLRNVEIGERHLMIRTPDGSVMGVTVNIAPDEETVYKLTDESAGSGGGLALRPILTFGSLGLSALLSAGTGVTLALANAQFGQASTAYDTYFNTSTASQSEYDVLWSEVQTRLESGRSLRSTGLILGGAAVLSAGAGTFLLLTAPSEDTALGKLKPYFFPWSAPDSKGMMAGVQLGLQGRF